MARAFIFTMDAVLALIPVFIILAGVSAISGGEILFLHTSILGEKRIAQDVLAVMDFSGVMGSANQTLLNQTLEKLIPSHLSYNYTIENLNGTQKFSIARGNIFNATDIVAARRIGTITSEYRVLVASTVLAPTVRDVKDDKAVALNAVLYALLGVKEIDANKNFDDWEDVGNVTISISELLAVSPATISKLIEKLIANADAQGSADAEDALTTFENDVLAASQRGLIYNTGDFLVYTASDVAMNISASDALLAAAQSANYRRGSLNPPYTPLTTIIGKDEDYGINFTLDIQTPTQIAVRSVGDTFYATKANVNLYVYETDKGSVKRDATINYDITSRPSFKIDKIEQRGAAIEVTVKSISYDTSGTGWINASATTYVPVIIENAAFKQQDKNKKINYNGQPKQEKLDVFKKYSGSIKDNYNEAEDIAKDGDLEKILEILSFQGKNVDKKEGYVTVSDVEFTREEDLITLKIWR